MDLLSLSHESFQPRFLANAVSMKASLQSAVRLISPNQSFAQHLLHHLEAAGSLVPSKSTMYRHRLTLTLSWCLRLQRQLASKDCSCTYFMVDSSPQGGVDLLQHIYMVLSESDLLSAWQLAPNLFTNPKASEAEEWMKSLSDILMWQQGPAVGIGSGKAGLFHKLHALLHARRLVSPSWESTVESFHQCIAFTGDMGIESLFASIAPFPLSSLIPWMSAETIDFVFSAESACTADFQHVSDSGSLGLSVPETGSQKPVQYHTGSGVFVAGMLHILHNIVGELASVMEHFSSYRRDLTALTAWLRRPHLRQRFQNTCLVGEFTDLQAWFHNFSLRVDTHRWGVVLDGTCEVLDLEEALRKGFNLEAYGSNVEGGEEVKMSRVKEVIESHLFWSYARMIAVCGRILQEITCWSEGCSCHSQQDFQSVNKKAFRRSGDVGCPMAGMRAPEMAAGWLFLCPSHPGTWGVFPGPFHLFLGQKKLRNSLGTGVLCL